MKLLYVGYISSYFGLNGEVKIISETNHKDKIFKENGYLYIDGKKYEIASLKKNSKYEIVSFKGLNNINDINFLLKKEVYVDKNDLDVDYLYIELINLKVYENDNYLGTIKEILWSKKYTYLKVNNLIIPLMDKYVDKIDILNNKVYVKNIGELNEN